MAAPLRVSACVIACDEADRIERCLAAVAFCDEVLVLDSGSRDDTVERARRMGARVVETDWPGWVRQKQRAVDAAAHDWVLCIDADEVVDAELRSALVAVRDRGEPPAGRARAFAVRRRVRFLDRWIRHGGWYPEWRVRLFDRRAARWAGQDPHDRVEVEGPVERVAQGHLEHHTFRNLADFVQKTNRFSTAAAEAKFAAGRRAGACDLWLRPAWRFLAMYVLRRGFLDGRAGLVVARTAAYGTFLKYAKLHERWEQRRRTGAG